MTTSPARTPEGKWTLYRRTDGQRYERWPVDARAMLATGEYTADPPTGIDSQPATVAPGSEAAPVAPALPAFPPALPVEHSPGVPLVAATTGTPASPFPTVSTSAKKGRK